MTLGPFWTSAAAVWGAVLSTVLAVLSIVPPWPKFHVEPKSFGGEDLTIRIVNPAKRMRFVRLCRCVPLNREKKTLAIYTDEMLKESPLYDGGRRRPLWIALKSESEAMVRMTWTMKDSESSKDRWLVIFGWQGAWIVPWIWVPVFVYVSTARAKRLNVAK
jgi:hypothetical protein